MTPKTQLNVRVSETTRRQLDKLAEQYGTQATALAVAIDRMHRAEDTMIKIMRGDDVLVSGQYIWLGNEVVAVLTVTACLVTDKQAQAWVDEHYPGIAWEWWN